ncbi:MAG TPA: LecA/PA-IL family lectin [Verrucomicrobiae bacterium]|nr:LecA/PA-IL family lectin [Verrucomicrobiae bacterium]
MKTTRSINHLLWSRPATLLLALLLWPGAEAATAQIIYTLDVPATTPWTDTGINLTAGSQLDITATGTVHYSTSSYQVCDANGGDYSGAQFLSDMMLPNTICHSLVGKIGGTTDVGTGTPVPEGIAGDGPGFVGTSYNELISTSGELFLGFNDDPSVFWDNSGSFSVTISITPVPEPGSIALFAAGAICLLACGWQRRRLIAQGNSSRH